MARKKVSLNGRHYNCNNDPRLNKYQQAHLRGEFDVNAPIPQDRGEPLPPLSQQWKEDIQRRFNGKNQRSSYR